MENNEGEKNEAIEANKNSDAKFMDYSARTSSPTKSEAEWANHQSRINSIRIKMKIISFPFMWISIILQ